MKGDKVKVKEKMNEERQRKTKIEVDRQGEKQREIKIISEEKREKKREREAQRKKIEGVKAIELKRGSNREEGNPFFF